MAADTYELQWQAGEPQRRVQRALPAAADLARCVAASDAEGISRLLHKFTAKAVAQEDWYALVIVLAEMAHPIKVAEVMRAVRGERADAA